MNKLLLIKSFFLVIFIIAGNVSCSSVNPLFTEKSEKQIDTKISGKIDFPSIFKIKSGDNKAGLNAGISLIYPSDHALSPNKVIATGVSDSNGSFVITSPFTPEINQIYILEAVKKADNSSYISMRTCIKWNGDYWESISKPGIYINSYTTAFMIVSGFSSGTVTFSDLINKLQISNKTFTPLSVKDVTSETVSNVANLAKLILLQDKDPFNYIKFENNKYIVDKTQDIGKQILYGDSSLRKISCIYCDMHDYNLNNIDLTKSDFKKADFSGMDATLQDFSEADLSDADFSNADLTKALLSGANLTNASFENANLTKTDFSEANLTGVNLKGVNAISTNFYGSDLKMSVITDGDFSGAVLRGVDFTGKTLGKIKFNNTDLSSGIFSGLNLKGVDFTGAYLDKVNLYPSGIIA